jgi:hypothetical protein
MRPGRPRGTPAVRRLGVATAFLALATPLAAQDRHQHASPYAHSGSDRVQTLTDEEVSQLMEGEGMGLARPAEMNGYPGPRHVLDLGDALGLTEDQRARTRSIFDEMNREAVSLGARVVAMEEALDRAFAERALPAELNGLVDHIAGLRGQLRWTHLRAHLEMATMLTEAQRTEYARLRGYHAASAGPGRP